MLNVTFLWYIFWHAIAQKKAGIFSDINFETLSGIFWHSIRHLFDTYSDIAVDMLPNMLSDTLSCFVDEYFDILSHLPSDVHSDILSFIWHFVQDSLRPTCWQFCGILSDIRSNIYCSLRTSSLAFCPTFSLTYIVAFLCDMSSDILSATYCSGPAISKEAARTRRGAEQAEEVEGQTWILFSFISELQGYKAGGIAIGFM